MITCPFCKTPFEFREKTKPELGYWKGVVCKIFGDDKGYTINEAGKVLKELIGEPYFYRKNGHEFVQSAADMNSTAMSDLITKGIIAAAQEGVIIPPPNKDDMKHWGLKIKL